MVFLFQLAKQGCRQFGPGPIGPDRINSFQSLFAQIGCLKAGTEMKDLYPGLLPVLLQAAVIEALTGNRSWMVERSQIYQEHHDMVVDGLEL